MAQVLAQFQQEVLKVEKLQKESQTKMQTEQQMNAKSKTMTEPNSTKPPSLPPPFSGTDLTPKEEGPCDQWVWQVIEALKTHTVGGSTHGCDPICTREK